MFHLWSSYSAILSSCAFLSVNGLSAIIVAMYQES